MSTESHKFSEIQVLERIITNDGSLMSPPVALEVLKWGFSSQDQQRMSELALIARQGNLTPEQREEIEGFELLACFLGTVKSKARRSLQQPAAPNRD